ncbi:IQ and ubiquitin-like domain-containing protein [Hippocampus comes]|uniref:IQ and ubiquitin-like domain-containing protein n=1 Tax=Hippocampus comes TaxID=109280 RepID=UPI00094E78BC|nr:PREDICTED: IQ and ubiquitin-like domain-containing protein [Hippocampus comes]
MSEEEGETIIPPVSEENQGEAGNEEHTDEAKPEPEDQGEAGNEEETLPGVSASPDQGEPGNEEDAIAGVSASEHQGEPGNEEQANEALPENEQGQPGNGDDTVPAVNVSEGQGEPGDEGESLPGVSTSEDRGEPGSEDQRGNDESLSQVQAFEDQGEPGNEDETLSGVNNSEVQEEQGRTEDEEANSSAGVKSSDEGPRGEEEPPSSSPPGQAARDEQSLSEPGVEPHGAVATEMTSSDPDAHLLLADDDSERDDQPNVINVSLITEDGTPQDLPAEAEPPRRQKAFLGGYRHKLTAAEYHHAASQTPRRARPGRGVDIVSRDAQTAEQVPQTQQCASSVTTQMTTVGCYISNMKDKLLSPGSYVTADEYHETRLNAVIRLQAHTRRWLSCRAVDRLRRQRDRRLAWLDLQERRRHEERAEQLQDSHSRWMQPRKREDLNLLYNALEKWRSDKERQINATLRGAERKAALCSLLEQETQYIATIGRHGIAIKSNNYNKAVRKFLDKSSTPHQWRAADGRLIEMDTPDTIRARELGDLYDCVAMSPVSQEQRLDILLCLKQTVEAHPCPLTRDIVELINREEDLMRRQVKAANLEGLRKRLCTYFLQFIRTPGFNPEVAKHLKVPQNTSQLRNDVFLCHGCQRYLSSTHFRSCARVHMNRRCLDCARLKNVAGSRDDFSCYKNILKRLRDAELLLNKDNFIPFILQVEDIQYLVEVIWGSRSALSGSSDLYSLVLVRWERHKDWSPWNCVLLCKEETDAHLLVEDLLKEYDVPIVRSVEHKHLLARRHYNHITAMAVHSAKAAAAAAAAAAKRGGCRT